MASTNIENGFVDSTLKQPSNIETYIQTGIMACQSLDPTLAKVGKYS